MLIAIMSMASMQAQTQLKKYWSDALSIKFLNEQTNTWSEWADWEAARVLIIIDGHHQNITIYSASPQRYDIVYVLRARSLDKDGDYTTIFRAVDDDGIMCDIMFTETLGKHYRLYVFYADIKWVYNIPISLYNRPNYL